MAFGLGNDKVDSDPNFLNFSSLDAAEMTCMASQTNLNVKIQSKRIRLSRLEQHTKEILNFLEIRKPKRLRFVNANDLKIDFWPRWHWHVKENPA